MERSFITVNGLPAKFISLGDGIEAKPKKIILIIPGKLHTYLKVNLSKLLYGYLYV